MVTWLLIWLFMGIVLWWITVTVWRAEQTCHDINKIIKKIEEEMPVHESTSEEVKRDVYWTYRNILEEVLYKSLK